MEISGPAMAITGRMGDAIDVSDLPVFPILPWVERIAPGSRQYRLGKQLSERAVSHPQIVWAPSLVSAEDCTAGNCDVLTSSIFLSWDACAKLNERYPALVPRWFIPVNQSQIVLLET